MLNFKNNQQKTIDSKEGNFYSLDIEKSSS